MGMVLNILIYFYLFAGLHCIQQMSWLPCQFVDHVFFNSGNATEVQVHNRAVVVQFGNAGDTSVNPHAITFLVSGSRVDLRRYLDAVAADQLDCELQRYKAEDNEMRWPGHGAHKHDCWFTCTFRHTEDLFTVTSLLRQGQEDCHSRAAIGDRDTIVTTVAMVLQTQSPSLIARLGSDQKLHCEFAVDHKKPHFTVDWHSREHGHRTRLFSHDSRTGQTLGRGVGLRSLAKGDASFSLPIVKIGHEGLYVCSVSVPPLSISQDITLHIQESPRVSLNVGSTLTLQEAGEQKVVCTAEGYYPLDVDIKWYQQEEPGASGQRVGGPLPRRLQNILLSSHRNNHGGTYSLSAFFYLKPSLSDSGSQFTCKVSHASLRMPIQKSFVLTVHEPSSWMLAALAVLLLVLGCGFVLLRLYSARRRSHEKPY
ncbi:tapasin-related protein isoform X2 [Lampris incognitus]|uniref:tapasin-related protein isoform X2 n=1 Tax=Lampris incognitus TaxID=2546036 RepID=UPI0024B5F39D|nr:tapasin-related protein isoform X2 [Lampris incognitus]